MCSAVEEVNGMSKQSAVAQLEALIKRRIELANFNIEVNENIAAGNVDGMLKVKDANGEYPIVVALGYEPLSLLVERISSIGGIANVFVKRKDCVSMIVAERPNGKGHPEDLSNIDEWESGASDIDMFLEYLRLRKDGVIVPDRLPGNNEFSLNISNAAVDLEKAPMSV